MAEVKAIPAEAPDATGEKATKAEVSRSPRKIPGNLTYLTNHGTFKNVLDKIISASKPEKFTQDYLSTVLGMSGGTSMAVIPILKRIGFLTSDGTPTELYAKFRTASGRAEACLGGLRAGFAELFRRNEHIYAAPDNKLTDLIVEVTGLTKEDAVVRAIRGTFRVLTSYFPPGFTSADIGQAVSSDGDVEKIDDRPVRRDSADGFVSAPFGLSYQINIVLPETKDVEVYNNIFKSLRDNLLRP